MNIILGKRINRRFALRGLTCAIGLPLLDGMTPARAGVSVKKAPTRVAFVYVPNGVIMPKWTPIGEGPAFELSPTLSPLVGFKNDITVVGGLRQRLGEEMADGPGDHARAAGNYLTCARPLRSASRAEVGISVDQRLVESLGAQTRLASLELTCDSGQVAGECDSGYNCAYQAALSWRSARVPQPAEVSPRMVFDRIFSDGRRSLAAERKRWRARRSILDFAMEDTKRLWPTLSRADQSKMDEYLSSVRAIEQQIVRSENNPAPNRPTGLQVPSAHPHDYSEHIELMAELIVLAFRVDATRIVSWQWGREAGGRTFPEQGGYEGHHGLSHHQNDPEKIAILARIDEFHVQCLARMLEKLRNASEGDGNLLDSSMITFGSGLSDGNRHRHHDLPTLVAGRGNGTIASGRHLVAPKDTPMSNLWLSLMHGMGATDKSFGDSTGPLLSLKTV